MKVLFAKVCERGYICIEAQVRNTDRLQQTLPIEFNTPEMVDKLLWNTFGQIVGTTIANGLPFCIGLNALLTNFRTENNDQGYDAVYVFNTCGNKWYCYTAQEMKRLG